jgi:hypothetical protein
MSTYNMIVDMFEDEHAELEANDNEEPLSDIIYRAITLGDTEALSNLADCIDLSEADEFIGYEFGPHMWHPNPLFSEPEYHAQILLEREIISLERCEALAKGLRFTNEELQHLKKIAAVDAMGENGTVWFFGTIDDGKYPCYFAVSRSGHSWDGFKENWEGFYLSREDIPDPWDGSDN